MVLKSWTPYLLALALPAAAAVPCHAASRQAPVALARVLAPDTGASVPRPGQDPPCTANEGCRRVYVRGKVPPGYWAFVAVLAMSEPSTIWIQPPVVAVGRDGAFESVAYLGDVDAGIGERFVIFVFAHPDKQRFRERDHPPALPVDCLVSDPVTVLRAR